MAIETFVTVNQATGAVRTDVSFDPNTVGGGETLIVEPKTIVTLNTIPNLNLPPVSNDKVFMAALGHAQEQGVGKDYVVSGQSVTWNQTIAGFNLDPGDVIIFVYSTV